MSPHGLRSAGLPPHRQPSKKRPGPMRSPTAVDIQNHLYASFLEGRTSDVALRVRGTWEAVYKLHRVVLIQCGFFRDLFTAGFVESSPKGKGRLTSPDEIDIRFDDRNITRAAFEICIARLYGGGPPLFTPPSYVPSPSHPLTQSFSLDAIASNAASISTPSSVVKGPKHAVPPTRVLSDDVPDNHQLADPPFLLSLLATSLYLSIPSVAAQALNGVLSTVGPRTAVLYLHFALGKSILSHGDERRIPAIGLEHVGGEITDTPAEEGYVIAASPRKEGHRTTSSLRLRQQSAKEEPEEKLVQGLEDLIVKKEDPSASATFSDEEEDVYESDGDEEGGSDYGCHYGAISDKIGEAAACWLARWGVDMLTYERNAVALYDGSNSRDTPIIWTSPRGGLSAEWVKAIVSSDSLFVQDEKARYQFAKGIVELRRQHAIIEGRESEDEQIWDKMFAEAIYYAHMPTEELLSLAEDISPSTGRPYIALSVLQDALWTQSLLRHRITARQSTSGNTSPVVTSPQDKYKELGISSSWAEIASSYSAHEPSSTADDKWYYPVPTDSSLRLGDNGNIEGKTMDDLFDLSRYTDSSARPHVANTERNFFGLAQDKVSGSVLAASASAHDITGDATFTSSSTAAGAKKWSPFPPYRFGVEFWDVGALREKNRLHSRTIWYAGSLFNVYVQVVRKKGVQLGVYLHRQSNIDPIPAASAPSVPVPRSLIPSISNPSPQMTRHTRTSSLSNVAPASPSLLSITPTHYSPSIHPPSRASTPAPTSPQLGSPPTSSSFLSSSSNSSLHANFPATAPLMCPVQPYRDPRSSIMAYFTIACASATGSALTRFASAPDTFSVSQSWGWKSSSLRTEEYLDIETAKEVSEGLNFTEMRRGTKEMSLRAIVVLGAV